MSQETRKHADDAKKYLQNAEKHLESAGESAKQSGDGGMVKQIERVKTDVGTVRKSLEEKLGGPKQA
jgi:hypothetical protein